MLHLPRLQSRLISRGGNGQLSRRDEIRPFRDPEWQANHGAAALLMPYREVWGVIERKGWSVGALQRRFAVSRQSTAIRLERAQDGKLLRIN